MDGVTTFEQVVRPLAVDRSWRWRVRRALLADLARRGGRVVTTGLSQMGWCHMGYPPPAATRVPTTSAATTLPRRM